MTRILSSSFALLVTALALSACHQSGASGSAGSGDVPAPTANVSDWGKFLADKGKLNNEGVSERPYNYVIPAGDDAIAKARRESEVNSIAHGVGVLFKPGSMLIIGGPDAKTNTDFLKSLAKETKPGSMKGVVVLVVNDSSQKDADSDALKSSEATVRFAAM
jgi:hypothetical protein